MDWLLVFSDSHMAMKVIMQDKIMNINTQQMLFIIDIADG